MIKSDKMSAPAPSAALPCRASRMRAHIGAAIITLWGLVATGAQAQTAIANGVTLMTGAAATMQNAYSVDLGSTAGSGYVTNMPLSLTYGGVNLNIAFARSGGVMASETPWNPVSGQNFLWANATLQFSAAQTYFGFAWSSPDNMNVLSFYNGAQLLASINGETFRTIAGVSSRNSSTSYAEFSFQGGGFDRVVATSSMYGFELGGLRFASVADPAPIPLGGLGGLMALAGFMGLRRGRHGVLSDACRALALIFEKASGFGTCRSNS